MTSTNILPISRTAIAHDTIADAAAAVYMEAIQEGLEKLWEAQTRLDQIEREIAQLSNVIATVTKEGVTDEELTALGILGTAA